MVWQHTLEVSEQIPKFDIAEFYPSITENILLMKALEFARTYTDINDDTTSINCTAGNQCCLLVRQQRNVDKARW